MLIIEAYRAEQERLHRLGGYGTASLDYGPVVTNILRATGCRSMLDYGCGLMQNLRKVVALPDGVKYQGYDPAIPTFQEKAPADLVVCIDVLEHIEPECIDDVLDDLRALTGQWAYFTVHCGPAKKTLSDGRNAHLIQKPVTWWLDRFIRKWAPQELETTDCGFNIVMRSIC